MNTSLVRKSHHLTRFLLRKLSQSLPVQEVNWVTDFAKGILRFLFLCVLVRLANTTTQLPKIRFTDAVFVLWLHTAKAEFELDDLGSTASKVQRSTNTMQTADSAADGKIPSSESHSDTYSFCSGSFEDDVDTGAHRVALRKSHATAA